jgi:hypothetical protein
MFQGPSGGGKSEAGTALRKRAPRRRLMVHPSFGSGLT